MYLPKPSSLAGCDTISFLSGVQLVSILSFPSVADFISNDGKRYTKQTLAEEPYG